MNLVYVVDWGKHYSKTREWNQESQKWESILPFKTILPDYSSIDNHWKYVYEDNLTLKGTINKREPKKLIEKIPIYKDFKWEIIETIKHPKAGEYIQSEDTRKHWAEIEKNQKGGYKIPESKYTTENILLLVSTHTDKDWMKCYIIIEKSGVSTLTPQQYTNNQFNAFIESNLNKWDRKVIDRKDIPKELISMFYDENDTVLFGSSIVKGLVAYNYIEGKFSTDGKPIYIGCCISYDGKGNSQVKDVSLIKSFKEIKKYVEQ